MKKSISIGRHTGNDVVLSFQQVSGRHAVLTPIASNSALLEDVGSSNGTYVNGYRIKRMIIGREDRVKIANILLDTGPYFAGGRNVPSKNNGVPHQRENGKENEEYVKEEFRRLEEVWESYQNIKLNHKKKGFWNSMAVSVIGMGLGAMIPVPGGMMLGSLMTRGVAGALKNDEKLQVIENEFKVNYVCPKCKDFIGYKPYEALVQQKRCFRCKTEWV